MSGHSTSSTSGHSTNRNWEDRDLLLDAGGILDTPPAGDGEDALVARSYAHPGLDGRVVVRFTAAVLGEAEDLALEFLGLERHGEVRSVGTVRRQALGFPAWALVNDPANGRHALAVVKEMERIARVAKSKPGAAKDGFEELAARIARAVPHFLPTFYEQAGRTFLEADSRQYAAMMFGKAREVEKIHNLAVDEDRLRAVFLEFAAAGAVSAKVLREHLRALTARLGPEEAYRQFRRLCLERAGAGLPPYAEMATDLHKAAKAAGRDQKTEDRELLRELLAGSAIGQGGAAFWSSYREPLALLAREEPEVRARLVEIMPTGPARSLLELDALWLGILHDGGVLDDMAERGMPDGGAGETTAAWLSRWAGHRRRGWREYGRLDAELRMVERLAPRLIAEGAPVDLTGGRNRVDMDVLDTCLALGVSVAHPEGRGHIDIGDWLEDEHPGRRELAHLMADGRFVPVVDDAVRRLGHHSTARLLLACEVPALREALARWLADRADDLGRSRGLPRVADLLDTVAPFVSPDVLAVNPEAARRIADTDLAPVLARSLRAGLFDELGWPALEDALDRLGPRRNRSHSYQDAYTVNEAWPYLVAGAGTRAIVVGPEDVVLEHDLRLPMRDDHWSTPTFRFVDGVLLACVPTDDGLRAYWTNRPDEVFTPEFAAGGRGIGISLPLPGGGRTTGGRPLHVGDTVVPGSYPVAADGVSFWALTNEGWAELDPVTGSHGRLAVPNALAAALREHNGATGSAGASELVAGASRLLPLVPGLEASPFGVRDGLLGWWCRREPDGTVVTRSVDGTDSARGGPDADDQGFSPQTAPLRLPGDALLSVSSQWRSLSLHSPDGVALATLPTGQVGTTYAAGTRLIPPMAFWHALRPRDVPGSLALRGTTDEHAAALLDDARTGDAEAARELAAVARGADSRTREAAEQKAAAAVVAACVEAVRSRLPEITDPRLVTGVAGVLAEASRLRSKLAAFGEVPAPRRIRRVEVAAGTHAHDEALTAALAALGCELKSGRQATDDTGPTWGCLRQIRAVNALFTRAADPRAEESAVPEVGVCGVDWPPLVGHVGAVAMRAAAPFTPDHQRAVLCELLEAFAAGPLGESDGRVRFVALGQPVSDADSGRGGDAEGDDEEASAPFGWGREGTVHAHGGVTTVVLSGTSVVDGQRIAYGLQFAPDGDFSAAAAPDGCRFGSQAPIQGWGGADLIGATVAALRDGPVGDRRRASVERFSEATGIAFAASALFLLIMPHGAAWGDEADPALALFGIGAADMTAARQDLGVLGKRDRPAFFARLAPAAARSLAAGEVDIDAGIAFWLDRYGRRTLLPPDLTVRAERETVTVSGIRMITDPQLSPELSGRTTQRVINGRLYPVDSSALLTGNIIGSAVRTLTWLAYRLPYGDPLRARLPAALGAIRERIADPGLLLDLGVDYDAKGNASSPRIRSALGMPETGGHGPDGTVAAGDGIVLAPWYRDLEEVWVRPAALAGPDDRTLVLLRGLARPSEALEALARLLSPDLDRLIEADGEPGHPHDPAASVPELVAEVSTATGLSTDAASLYLQLLALPDPTDKNVAEWTGWKPARAKKARAELLASGLVVEAKRPRAGRTLFLPGGWQAHKAPALPIETWKERLFGGAAHRYVVPDRPVPELFAEAWRLVGAGEGPGFEEFTRRGR